MIKIIHIITSLNMGGAENMLFKTITNSNRNFKHKVISLKKNGIFEKRLNNKGIDVISFNFEKKLFFIYEIYKLITYLRKNNSNIIHGWMYHGCLMSFVASFLLKNKTTFIWNIRQTVYKLRYEKVATTIIILILALFSHFPNKIIFNSKISMKQHNKLGFTKKNNLYIPNGFDVKNYRYSEIYRDEIRKKFNVKPHNFFIGMINRFHPMKGHNTFFESAKLIQQVDKNFVFLIAGKGVPHNSKISKFLQKMPYPQNFFLVDQIDDIIPYFSAIDLYINSSSWGEGFSNLIGESLLCKTPCIATDIGDNSNIIEDKAFIVPPNNPKALSNAILRYFNNKYYNNKNLKNIIREKIVNRYNIVNITYIYDELYKSFTI